MIIFYPLELTFKANFGHFWPSYILEIWNLCSFEILTDHRSLEQSNILRLLPLIGIKHQVTTRPELGKIANFQSAIIQKAKRF